MKYGKKLSTVVLALIPTYNQLPPPPTPLSLLPMMTKPLEELENMKGADVLYHKVMQKNKEIIEERMSSMKLGGR